MKIRMGKLRGLLSEQAISRLLNEGIKQQFPGAIEELHERFAELKLDGLEYEVEDVQFSVVHGKLQAVIVGQMAPHIVWWWNSEANDWEEGYAEGKYSILTLIKEDDSISHETGASGDSIDSQVDRYLGQYEGDAKKADSESPGATVGAMESIDWRDLIKGHLITEAEGDDDQGQADKKPDEAADDAAPDEPPKLGMENLDVAKFADNVVRLIDNYDSLLEVRNTLLRRAKSFLKKTYDDETLKAFDDVLRDDHGMEAGTDDKALAADKFPAPAADRASGSAEAGPGGAGGGA